MTLEVENRKKRHISWQNQQVYFLQICKDLLITQRRLTRVEFLDTDLSPAFLNTGTTDENFQILGKQDSFKHILERSPTVHEI